MLIVRKILAQGNRCIDHLVLVAIPMRFYPIWIRFVIFQQKKAKCTSNIEYFIRIIFQKDKNLLSLHRQFPPSLSLKLKCAGLFLFIDMARRSFIKTYSSPSDLVQLLKIRGMEINDERKAAHYIENIGYYRLSAYMYPFLKMPKCLHQYKVGASFKKILVTDIISI